MTSSLRDQLEIIKSEYEEKLQAYNVRQIAESRHLRETIAQLREQLEVKSVKVNINDK